MGVAIGSNSLVLEGAYRIGVGGFNSLEAGAEPGDKKIDEHIEKVTSSFKAQIDAKFEEIDFELKPIKESYSEIKILLEKLQKTITDFRNIT